MRPYGLLGAEPGGMTAATKGGALADPAARLRPVGRVLARMGAAPVAPLPCGAAGPSWPGRSPLDFGPYQHLHIEGFIEDLATLMDHLGGGPVYYCGESLGGILGIVLRAIIPERLRSLTLVAASVTIPKPMQQTFACGHASWQDALRNMGSKDWSEAVNCDRTEEAQIRAGVPGIRVINLPTRFRTIQVLMPAACAKALLHFCGEVDGVANHD